MSPSRKAALALISAAMREALEIKYLWQVPFRLDNAKSRALIGDEPHTELHQVVRETLAAIRCLPEGVSKFA